MQIKIEQKKKAIHEQQQENQQDPQNESDANEEKEEEEKEKEKEKEEEEKEEIKMNDYGDYIDEMSTEKNSYGYILPKSGYEHIDPAEAFIRRKTLLEGMVTGGGEWGIFYVHLRPNSVTKNKIIYRYTKYCW